ncbi:MAG: hypothetical protein F4244_12100 [Gammaproteobacteria bacterium]|nr:hypothetical protein [Gammaproteobacteria bacterium]
MNTIKEQSTSMSQKKNCLQLIENILEKIYDLPDGPFWIADLRNKKYSFPIMLGVGNGSYIHINPEIDGLLAQLSSSILQEYFRQHEENFSNPEWERMVKKAFGEALVGADEESISRKEAEKTLDAVVEKVKDSINEIQEREHVFGCDLCNIEDLKRLVVGPVSFEPRNAWLERIHDKGNISEIAVSRIQKIWRGETLRERVPSEDSIKEEEIIDVIGKCKFACSVRISKAGTDAGLNRALTAARLAMTVIALFWKDSSYALERIGLTYDRTEYLQKRLSFSFEGRFSYGRTWTHIPGGITELKKEEWEQIPKDLKINFPCAEEVIIYAADGQSSVTRPEIMHVFFQALLWFHEGCREKVDAMAIVKFCAVLEALSCGRKENGIFNLVNARLKINDEIGFRDKLRRIYKMGRSRTVHGTNDKLLHDWSDDRKFAEELCRLCLLSCLELASQESTLKDPHMFSVSDK